MFKVSTGMRNYLLGTGDDLAAGVSGFVIRLYSGTVPATADATLGAAVLMCTISNDATGTGITMDPTPVSGVLSKTASEVWRGVYVAGGTPTFYRFSSLADAGADSSVERRLQGSVGILNEDLLISTAVKAINDEQRIDSYYIGMPSE